jgi:hypothetical protein
MIRQAAGSKLFDLFILLAHLGRGFALTLEIISPLNGLRHNF